VKLKACSKQKSLFASFSSEKEGLLSCKKQQKTFANLGGGLSDE
jgi:hypothetical protein